MGQGNSVLVVFDVDGTLSSSAGSVTAGQVHELEALGIRWGILSSRSRARSQEACDILGLKPQFINICRVDGRTEELRMLKGYFPRETRRIYVADREIDKQEALRAGWEFCFASEMDGLLKELNDG